MNIVALKYNPNDQSGTVRQTGELKSGTVSISFEETSTDSSTNTVKPIAVTGLEEPLTLEITVDTDDLDLVEKA
jgi:hypothetical protein